MKKFTIFAVIIAMVMSFAGCGGNAEAAKVETTVETTEATVETTIETIVETTETATEPEETIGEFYWPTFGISEKIPTVDWTTRGAISVDTEDSFYADIYETDLKTYSEYVSKCQELGYTVDYCNYPGSSYFAENEEGYSLMLYFYKDKGYMSISLYNY